jgi:hypothetical protein
MPYWLLADLVLTFHITLFVALGAGAVLAALGFMGRRRRLDAAFWSTLAVTLGWTIIPVKCGLTELEVWLRQQVEPDYWGRPLDLPQTVTKWLTGAVMPSHFFLALSLLLLGLAIFGFWRYYFRKGEAPTPPPNEGVPSR